MEARFRAHVEAAVERRFAAMLAAVGKRADDTITMAEVDRVFGMEGNFNHDGDKDATQKVKGILRAEVAKHEALQTFVQSTTCAEFGEALELCEATAMRDLTLRTADGKTVESLLKRDVLAAPFVIQDKAALEAFHERLRVFMPPPRE